MSNFIQINYDTLVNPDEVVRTGKERDYDSYHQSFYLYMTDGSRIKVADANIEEVVNELLERAGKDE